MGDDGAGRGEEGSGGGKEGGWGRVVEVERVGGREGSGEVWRVEVERFEYVKGESEKGNGGKGNENERGRKSWTVLGAVSRVASFSFFLSCPFRSLSATNELLLTSFINLIA